MNNNAWDEMKKLKNEKGNLFLKLADGESVEGIFRGEPFLFYQKFKDPTEHKEWAEGRSFKFKINFLVKENGIWIAKILQGGSTIRDLLLDAKDEYGIDCVFKFKRVGLGREDTRYSLLFKAQLTPEQIEAANRIKLNSFERKIIVPVFDEFTPSMNQEDAPF